MRRPAPASGEQVFAGRFTADRLLKQAQGIETWLGADEDGRQVVIKATAAGEVSDATHARLEHEAAALEGLACPHLTPLVHLGRDGGRLFLVTPFVAGATLEERLAAGGLSVGETIAVARCLLLALKEAHEHGVLHRDVKPANVIVDEDGQVARATLIDFGLARSSRLGSSLRDLPVGTAHYLSPEQAGLLGQGVDGRADLYSLGVTFYRCLAGRLPFPGDEIGEVLRQHLGSPPPPLGPTVPAALEALVRRLLQKDPRDRYQSAAAALEDLEEIAAALARGVAQPSLVVGARDRRRRTLTEPAFVGRAAEMAALEGSVEEARAGKGGVVLLEADSGGGKTRLLDELARRAAERGAWVLRGQGLDQTAQRPLQVLRGVVRGVVAAARARPEAREALRASLGEHVGAASGALPELENLLGAVVSAEGPEAYGEARSLPALAALLAGLGTAARPAVVLLDDCQWADELAGKLLASLAREPPRHVLVVAAFRGEETPAGHLLRSLAPCRHLTLGALDGPDLRSLVVSMAGPVPDEIVDAVTRLSEGSPFMAVAVLHGLVEAGALYATPEGWSVEPALLSEAQSSSWAASFLARRLERLPADALRLLSVGAVLGKEFDLEAAAALAGRTPAQLLGAVEEARRRHMLWTDAGGTRCLFVHDKLREALLGRLSAEEARDLHRSAAERMEAREPDRVFDLAYHFDAAGDAARALPYALAAAERARAQHALEVAETQYRIAERGAGAADAPTRRRLCEGLGVVLMLRGSYLRAAVPLEAARALAESDEERARIEGQLGELAFKQGDAAAAATAIERALRLLGRRVPRSGLARVLWILWEILVQAAHTLLPRRLYARRRGAAAARLAMRLYSRFAYASWFTSGLLATLWAHLRELNLGERYPPTPELGQACASHGVVMAVVPWIRRGLAYAERGLAVRRKLGDVWGEGQSLHFQGIVLLAAARWNEAALRLRAAVRLLERTGDRWEALMASGSLAWCQYRLGDLAGAVETSRGAHHAGLEIGDEHVAGTNLDMWARASGGRVPAEVVQAALARSQGDAQTLEAILQAEALRLLGEGRPGEAARAFAAADRWVRFAHLRGEYVAGLPSWRAHALRREAARVSALDPGRRRALLRQARAAARRGLRLARKWPGNLPLALRELGLLAAIDGRARRARRLLDDSIALAGRQGARFEHAQSRLWRGRVGLLAGWPGAADEIGAAERSLHALGADFALADETSQAAAPSPTLSLADRFTAVVEAGRRIASALAPEAIFAHVDQAARTVLRGEECLVLTLPVDEGAPVSKTLVERALNGRRPAIWSGEASESLVLSGVRSALCAPIFVRGRPAGCFYLTHRQVGGLFGEEEARLAAFIATLAGAALENAEGFAAIQDLSRSLEQRVAERTEALSDANRELGDNLRVLRETQDQLLQAGKLAAIGTLVAGLSHELNNPLSVILGYAQNLLRRAPSSAGYRPALAAIERQALRCSELVRRLLDFSRKKPSTREWTSARALVERVVELAGLQARGIRVSLEVHSGHLPDVYVCSQEIESALLNLVQNALDASRKEGVVEISCRRASRAGVAGIEVAVEDGGSGITEEVMPRIFDPFFTTKPVGQGTGLGLPLARRIVEAHGGGIEVASTPGKGTTMKVWVPLTGGAQALESV